MSINYPTVTITAQVKKEMESRAYRDYIDAQNKVNSQGRTVDSARKSLVVAESDLKVFKDDVTAKWNVYDAARRVKADTYALVDRFGSQKPAFTSLFSNPKDYVYVAQSRTGGMSHTARIDEGTGNWRCDCKGGTIRGACWLTKAIQKGVKLDLSGNPFVVDESGKSRDVARFKRQV
jgi:hypothetical protein